MIIPDLGTGSGSMRIQIHRPQHCLEGSLVATFRINKFCKLKENTAVWQSNTTTVEIVLIYCVVYITDKGNAIDIQIDCYVQNHTQIVCGLVHPG